MIKGPLTSLGGNAMNDTLPPLLGNFSAKKWSGNSIFAKDIPEGSTVVLGTYKNKPIKWIATNREDAGEESWDTGTDLPTWKVLRIYDRDLISSRSWNGKIQTLVPPVGIELAFDDSGIGKWLNSSEERNLSYDEAGFLYQWKKEEKEILITYEWGLSSRIRLPSKVPKDAIGGLVTTYDINFMRMTVEGDKVDGYYYPKDIPYSSGISPYASDVSAVGKDTPLKIEPICAVKGESKFIFNGTDYILESALENQSISISADKLPSQKANDLAGAVWVYGEHEPKNVNDGTKVNLTREEIVLPEEGDTDIPPISYTELERPTANKTWTAPEDGYYKFVGVAMGGYSGTARRTVGASYNVSGGSGGSGGIVASVFKLKRGENVSLAVERGDITISYGSETARATHGESGGSSSSDPDNKVRIGIYGKAGTATGGNLVNMNGKPGGTGRRLEGNKAEIVRGGETVYEKHISRGGYAQSTRQEGDMVPADRGTTSYIAVLKGDSSSNKPLNFTTKATKTISMLPSKSKVKLGRYKGKTLIWDKGTTQSGKTVLTTNKETSTNIIPKTFQYDNREPQNPSSTIRESGNARYLWSNVRQWLNAKGTGWYKSQHTYDAPPTYQNEAGFLTDWDDKDLSVIKQGSWKSFSGVDGNNTLDTITDKIAIIGAGEIVDSFDHSNFVRDKIDWAKSPSDIAINATYWTRDCTTAISGRVGVVGFQGNIGTGGYAGVQATGMALMLIAEVNPDTRVSENPDSDGCYTINFEPEFSKQVEKQVQWDNTKDFYARQFTYNPKKQYQTMLEGAIAFIYRPTMKVGDLPSKSTVKLGKYTSDQGLRPANLFDLTWNLTRDKQNNLFLVMSKETCLKAPFNAMMFDEVEPENPDTNRRTYGNNRFIYSNALQWLNAEGLENGLNDWEAFHDYDAMPPYAMENGFLKHWSKQEKEILLTREWNCPRSTPDGGGTDILVSRVVLPDLVELGYQTHDRNLDIFKSNSDRAINNIYWTRNPVTSLSYSTQTVNANGTKTDSVCNRPKVVRPLVAINPDALVYAYPDVNGNYEFVLNPPTLF